MRLVAVVFALLLALVAGKGGAIAVQATASGSMSMAPAAPTAPDQQMPAGVDSTAVDAAAVADLVEVQTDPDDRTEAIACSTSDLPAHADAFRPAAERPRGTPRPWLAGLLRPPRTTTHG